MINASSDNCVFVTEESMRADKAMPGSSGHCRLAYIVTRAFSKQSQQTRCSCLQGREASISQGTCLKLCFHFFQLRAEIVTVIHDSLQFVVLSPSWVKILRLEAVGRVGRWDTAISHLSRCHHKIKTPMTSWPIGSKITFDSNYHLRIPRHVCVSLHVSSLQFTYSLLQTPREPIPNLNIFRLTFYISRVWGHSFYQTINTELVNLPNLT